MIKMRMHLVDGSWLDINTPDEPATIARKVASGFVDSFVGGNLPTLLNYKYVVWAEVIND